MTNSESYWFRPFVSEDAKVLQAQAKQEAEFEALKMYGEEGWRQIESHGRAFTGFCRERMLGVAGFNEYWPSRWAAWSVLSHSVNRRDMLWIHRTVRQVIADVPHRVRRLELTVLSDFHPAHHWAEMLGFKAESEMRTYDQLGRDHVMYVRLRD